ncbi:MAG: F-type H+-transporting ATPase subunit c [Acidobacteriota bacterium]|nr:F-type H+-transporting ATPase subunit c [Acidobacteriota bacterium]
MNKKVIIMMFVMLALLSVSAFAQSAPATTAAAGSNPVRWGALSAAFVLGLAAAAGAIGQSRAIVAACEGIARNPGAAGAIRLSMIIGLALIESLVIYALLIAFFVYQL